MRYGLWRSKRENRCRCELLSVLARTLATNRLVVLSKNWLWPVSAFCFETSVCKSGSCIAKLKKSLSIPWFSWSFTEQYVRWLKDADQSKTTKPVVLYLHIHACTYVCTYDCSLSTYWSLFGNNSSEQVRCVPKERNKMFDKCKVNLYEACFKNSTIISLYCLHGIWTFFEHYAVSCMI